ncbi:hypothetical protein KKA13_03685 [Patescibacteria group bacterium]|nr:hypothetical protein [Patescibacteria group bacterium]MBU1613519.1 hypothetical protein [Patescibacteria group bacterium]
MANAEMKWRGEGGDADFAPPPAELGDFWERERVARDEFREAAMIRCGFQP